MARAAGTPAFASTAAASRRGTPPAARIPARSARSPAGETGGVVPLIQQLNAQTDEWRALEIARAKKLLAKLDQLCTYACPEEQELRRWIDTAEKPS